MSLADTVIGNLRRSIELYRELAAGISERALTQRLAGMPSNAIGQQLWCVIGARESYCRAIEAGEWAGFECSLGVEETRSASHVTQALDSSGKEIMRVCEDIELFSETQNQLLVDLLEHEVAHHGQLIRYLYGLRLAIPAGWKARYALN